MIENNKLLLCEYEIPALVLAEEKKQQCWELSDDKRNWELLQNFLKLHYDDDCLVLVQDACIRLSNDEQEFFLSKIQSSLKYDAKLLLVNATELQQIIDLDCNFCWIDHFGRSSCAIIFNSLFKNIVEIDSKNITGFWRALSSLTSQKILLYPFLFNKDSDGHYQKSEEKIKKILDVRQQFQLIFSEM